MKKLRIGILGIGAIGSVITLNLAGKDNYFYFNRSDKTSIEILFGEARLIKEIKLSDFENPPKLDWLIICLKEYQFEGAEEILSKLIGEKTNVAVIRNGLNLKEPILKYTVGEKVLECMIDCPVQKLTEGKYMQLSKPEITVKKGALSLEFEKLFIAEQVKINQVEDFITINWEKVIESSAIGGILSLSGETIWIFEDQEVLDLYDKVIAEGILVARQEGAKIGDNFRLKLKNKLNTYPKTKGSSMLSDRLNGNRVEINAKNGIISEYGKKHQIKTEINDIISILLRYTNVRK